MNEAGMASYEARRAGILEVLDGLIGHWEMAEGLSALIGSEFVTLEAIDGIEKILRESIKTVEDIQLQKKLADSADKIHDLKIDELVEIGRERDEAKQIVENNFI